MLPYFRSMEAFFDLSLPKSWADLSDTQLLFFFRQLATDKPAPPIGEVLRTAMNTQIRALTGGDITKEEAVLSMDTSTSPTSLSTGPRRTRRPFRPSSL